MRTTSFMALLPIATEAFSVFQPQQLLQTRFDNPQEEVVLSESIDKKPLINSTDLQALIKPYALITRAYHLYGVANLSIPDVNHPTRVIGSAGHNGTLEYIYSTLAKLGDYYTLSNQSFPAVVGDVFESRLVLGNAVPASTRPMSLSPPTPNKQPVFAPVSLAGSRGCEPSDFGAHVKGTIVLVERGDCAFGDKSANAGKAGALAAVVYNNGPGGLGGTLGDPVPEHVPTFGISPEDVEDTIATIKKGGKVEGIAYIDSTVDKILTTNIIAQTIGGDPDNCVMLGGHSDSVGEGPGINDDGSGSLTLLEIATQLAKFEVKNCVRFAWWAGEEEGLLGSDYYVEQLTKEENAKIRLFMDYDMLASPNYAYQVYDARDAVNPKGSQALRDLYTGWYEAQGLNWTYIPFDGRSDYDAFIKNGIPGGGIATGAEGVKTPQEKDMFGGKAGEWYDHCYHQLCDDVSNLNMEAWAVNARLVAHSVATYALSFDGFPERDLVDSMASTGYSPLYHGSDLIM